MADDKSIDDKLVPKQDKKPKNIFDALGQLSDAGVPIFQQDLNDFKKSVFRAMYYAAKANVTNPYVIFPHIYENHPPNPLGIYWLVSADSIGLGEPDISEVYTGYERKNKGNDHTTKIIVRDIPEYTSFSSKLPDERVKETWDLMKKMLPEEEFTTCSEKFDIVKWYKMASQNLDFIF